MKFRRRKKILPGIYLNFSQSGISTTFGPKEANINIGKKGVHLNAGIPGTGIYTRKKIGDYGNSNYLKQSIPVNYVTKSKTTAIILALFLGGLGIHQFYLGNNLRGLIYLIFCWTFIPIIIALFDILILLTMSRESFNLKYNQYI